MTKRKSSTRTSKRSAKTRVHQAISWTDRALLDLEAIGDYIARDNPSAAERWVMKLIAVAENAAVTPLAGRRVPELARDDVREVFLRSYRIVYRVRAERVEIMTVFEGHKLFADDNVVLESEERRGELTAGRRVRLPKPSSAHRSLSYGGTEGRLAPGVPPSSFPT